MSMSPANLHQARPVRSPQGVLARGNLGSHQVNIPVVTPGNRGVALRPQAPTPPTHQVHVPVATPGSQPAVRTHRRVTTHQQQIPVSTPSFNSRPIPRHLPVPATVYVSSPPVIAPQPAILVYKEPPRRAVVAIGPSHRLSLWDRFINFLKMIFCCKC